MDGPSLPRRYQEECRFSDRLRLARDRLSDRPVALKLAEGPGPDAARELAREYAVLRSCPHPTLPQALDFGVTVNGWAWFVMERVTGRRPSGPLALPELLTLGAGLCEALALLHSRGILHRDLKPANVLMDEATGRVVLVAAPGPAAVRDAREAPAL